MLQYLPFSPAQTVHYVTACTERSVDLKSCSDFLDFVRKSYTCSGQNEAITVLALRAFVHQVGTLTAVVTF